ncbi:TetR/AcrR family transcriptional regulator [Actinosynnema pretiosum subsp. pretiosum]|uniref:TetR/AcrR family transcriptional regulator n=1 Tax=Actinosynnema pretiosum subsp. pretiosum TaxID=103721 RepID=A0AA45L6Q4_9PSEU|nr:putative transcriptional regulator, TetR family [Actinosynnema pretiosum subsp. pretiosum]QUF04346.1 TetR/AcrR family transcriptional regulator [Actinosynnema pretiosum subsp. pretiosum]
MTADRPAEAPRSRKPRVDAARNQEAIVEAAARVLAEQGAAVDVREIARLSGVGMGTLYRHFPTKEDLVRTILRREFLTWAASAREAAERAEDPWAALADFFRQALSGYARHRAISECFALAWAEPDVEGLGELRAVIEGLTARAHEAGSLRPDASADDLLLLLVSLGHAARLTGDSDPEQVERLLRVSLDGLRPGHAER